MNVSEFDYHLPPELIAQEPARPRDSSRLLVVHRETGELEHRGFRDVLEYLRPDDVMVLNETRVIRARLPALRSGGGKAEVLLLEDRGEGVWEALVSPGRRLPPGRDLVFPNCDLRAEILERTPSGGRLLRFTGPAEALAAIPTLGEVPLPPYITRPLEAESDYQTVYARCLGSSAAPTAGLHFTPEVLEQVRVRVRAVTSLSLHIGVATFRPMHVEEIEEHEMHTEKYCIPEATAREVNRASTEGRRVLAVGTTSVRALEAAAREDGRPRGRGSGNGSLPPPGSHFRVVGGLLTNFHQPRSSLLALVCAFAGKELIFRAYEEAVARRYRFFSFGDAMLIV